MRGFICSVDRRGIRMLQTLKTFSLKDKKKTFLKDEQFNYERLQMDRHKRSDC